MSFDETARVRLTDDVVQDFPRDGYVTPTESASEGSTTGDDQDAPGDPAMLLNSAGLQVGVLHLEPTLEKFPLLREGHEYDPNIFDMLTNAEERDYWLNTLERLQPGLVERALVSDAQSADVQGARGKFRQRLPIAPLETSRRTGGVRSDWIGGFVRDARGVSAIFPI